MRGKRSKKIKHLIFTHNEGVLWVMGTFIYKDIKKKDFMVI